MLIQKRFML